MSEAVCILQTTLPASMWDSINEVNTCLLHVDKFWSSFSSLNNLTINKTILL